MTSFSVGATLREARIRKQISLEEVARQTKIPERLLKAIESEDFDSLPGVIFTRNFVRQYASLLDIDPNPLLAALPSFDLETAPLPAPPVRTARNSRWDPRWNSALASIAWTILAGGAAVAAYLHFNHPPRIASVEAAPVAAPIDDRRAPPTPATTPGQQNVAQQAAAEPIAGSQPGGPSAAPVALDDKRVRATVTAHEDSWLQITADGKNAYSGILKANDTRSFSADGLIKVLTGNAGGIEISLNGKAIDSLGPVGQVRSVRLTAEGPQYAPKNPLPSPDPI